MVVRWFGASRIRVRSPPPPVNPSCAAVLLALDDDLLLVLGLGRGFGLSLRLGRRALSGRLRLLRLLRVQWRERDRESSSCNQLKARAAGHARPVGKST